MEATLTKIDSRELSSFVKKLLPIDKFIFLKIGKEGTVSSVYFPERDAVKLANTPTVDLFEGEIDVEKEISIAGMIKQISLVNMYNTGAFVRYNGEVVAF